MSAIAPVPGCARTRPLRGALPPLGLTANSPPRYFDQEDRLKIGPPDGRGAAPSAPLFLCEGPPPAASASCRAASGRSAGTAA
jgi:hypothetical protein